MDLSLELARSSLVQGRLVRPPSAWAPICANSSRCSFILVCLFFQPHSHGYSPAFSSQSIAPWASKAVPRQKTSSSTSNLAL